MAKQLYLGSFNLFGGTHKIYRWATTLQQSKRLMLLALAKQTGYTFEFLMQYFNGGKDNYGVKPTPLRGQHNEGENQT